MTTRYDFFQFRRIWWVFPILFVAFSVRFYTTIPTEWGPKNFDWVILSMLLGALAAGSVFLLALFFVPFVLPPKKAPR